MELSVIFTTYNHPKWLEKVLWGFSVQTFKNFEVIVADDGSGPETAETIDRMRKHVPYPIQHVWQEDDGFRKCEILNKAIVSSKSDYLVFTDGDCIPRKDFLQVHYKKRKPNHFLSGGLIRLPLNLSRKITKDQIISQTIFDKEWLIENGLKNKFFKNIKLTRNKKTAEFMNTITPTTASWNGHNASTWKKNVLAINGFDERMKYGGQDREFGERLINSGLNSIQIRHSAICLHLDHSRGYVTSKHLAQNKKIRKTTKKNQVTSIPFGIKKKSFY